VIINTAQGSAFLIGNNIVNTMYIEGGVIGFSGLLVTTTSTPTSPPFEPRLPGNASGQSSLGTVTALQGETG
jgi:hypothetical protein